jgi:hypothetical protein
MTKTCRPPLARISRHRLQAYRIIAVAVRDWEHTIPTISVRIPNVLNIDLPPFNSPSEVHWYMQILERFLARSFHRLEARDDVRTVQANIDAAQVSFPVFVRANTPPQDFESAAA